MAAIINITAIHNVVYNSDLDTSLSSSLLIASTRESLPVSNDNGDEYAMSVIV